MRDTEPLLRSVAAPAKAVGHSEHYNISFVLAWTSTESLPNFSGNYYLTNDVTLKADWYVVSTARSKKG